MQRADGGNAGGIGSEDATRSSILTMDPDMLVVIGSIVTSLVVIPAILLAAFLVRGVPTSGGGYLGIGLVAMTPGVLMGTTALWVAARG